MHCLVVDDHPLTRDGTALALREEMVDLQVHEASSLQQAFRVLAEASKIDLILLDLDLEDSGGMATLRSLKEWCDERDLAARIVVVSGHCEPDLVQEVIGYHGTGFILKATSKAIFKHAIALTLAGGVYIPEAILKQMGGPSRPQDRQSQTEIALTPREVEVATLLVQGFTYKKIARELERHDGKPVSDHTVRVHVGNIAWKLGVTENAKSGVMAELARRELRFPPLR